MKMEKMGRDSSPVSPGKMRSSNSIGMGDIKNMLRQSLSNVSGDRTSSVGRDSSGGYKVSAITGLGDLYKIQEQLKKEKDEEVGRQSSLSPKKTRTMNESVGLSPEV